MSGLYQAHESFWADVKMYVQMFFRAILAGVILQFLIISYAINTHAEIFSNISFVDDLGTKIVLPKSVAFKYHTEFSGLFSDEVEIEKELLPYINRKKAPIEKYRQYVDYLTENAYFKQDLYFKKWLTYSVFSYLVSLIYLYMFAMKSKKMSDDKFIRGAQLTPINVMNKKLEADAKKTSTSCLKIGETLLPFSLETKHILVLGTSGSGKGVLLNQLISQINNRKCQRNTDRCIVYDLKGEFVSKQFRDGDLIFSPFDSRSLGWNIFNEIEIIPDLDVISSSLFSPPAESEPYWYLAAADVFRAGLIYLKLNNKTTNNDLWNFFSQPQEGLKTALYSLPVAEQGALKHISQTDSPAASSVLSILQSRLKFFYYLVGLDGEFSFRKFMRERVRRDGPQPNLFILNTDQYASIFGPLMSLGIDTMCREILSMPDDLNRRTFFIIDELGTLNRMDSIIKLETVGRSKGASLICSNQDLGKVEEQYGKANLKSFINNFNTTFTFRIKDPETADFLSRAIGEQQVIKTSQSRQMSPNEIGDRKSVSEQERTERLILPAEYQALTDLSAYVNIAGYGVSKIAIPPVFFKEQHPNFIMRNFEALTGPEVNVHKAKIQQTPPEQINFAKLK